nr:aminotransferase [uncultured Roseovarius sp.]
MKKELSLEALDHLDRAHLIHPGSHLRKHADGETEGRIITRGEGIYVYTKDGRKIIDGFAGLYSTNIGYGQRQVIDAIINQLESIPYYPTYVGSSNEPAIQLAEKIISIAPKGMSRVYYGLSGSDANETAVKLAWYYQNIKGYPEKKKIISRDRAYHGSGFITGSLTGLPAYQNGFDLPLSPFLHTMCPHFASRKKAGESEADFTTRCAMELDALITAEGPDTIAAFIAEPVMGTGGIIVPPKGYFAAIQAVLKKHDILLIIDEVVTGFGRLGSWFGSTHYDISPDIMTLAKGLTSAYLPLSATVVNEEVWSAMLEGSDKFGVFGHGWTYSGHPTCAAAGLANIELLESLDVLRNVQTNGSRLNSRLQEALADHPHVGEVRGEGMLAAIEFFEDCETRKHFEPLGSFAMRVMDVCWENNLIVRALQQGDIISLAPPLIATAAEIDEIVDILVDAIGETTRSR